MSYYAVIHQSLIGLELQKQSAMIDRNANVLIGCVGGGSKPKAHARRT